MADNSASLIEEEFNVVAGDYSIIPVCDYSPESLTKSQYAKVIFHDIADTYLTDADICCRYSLTDGVTPQHGDRVALYRVGWTSVQDYIVFQWAPGPAVVDKTELQVLFKASSLPKDVQEFYQLCYVTADNVVCGASVPFQFRLPYENELCAVEETDGLMVVRSRSALTEEKLRQTMSANELLHREKSSLEKNVSELRQECSKVSTELQEALQNLSKLQTEKQVLEERLEKSLHVEHHVERLQKDLMARDAEKNQSLLKLNKAEQHIKVLTTTLDTLNADKEYMAQLLRTETQDKSGVMAEVGQYKSQAESLSHMLEAMAQSKELVAQELRNHQATNTQLMQDIQRLEAQSREQQNKITELEKEKKSLQELLDQALNTKHSAQAKDLRINQLEKEKDEMLSKFYESARKKEEELQDLKKRHDEELKGKTAEINAFNKHLEECKEKEEENLKDLNEMKQKNQCLTQQLTECKDIICSKDQALAQALQEKESVEQKYKRAMEMTVEENIRLKHRITVLENEAVPLQMQLEESNMSHARQKHFKEVFTDIKTKLAYHKIELEETESTKQVQTGRIESITKSLADVDAEVQKLQAERQDVVSIRDAKEEELSQAVERLTVEESLRSNYLTEDDSWIGNPVLEPLRESMNELTLFVESSKMRINDIDQRLTELEEEKSILMQQKNQATERMNVCERSESQLQQEILELEERERELVAEYGGQLETVQEQLDQALYQNSEILASGLSKEEELALARKEMKSLEQQLQDSKSNQDQEGSSLNSCLEQEQELKLRLQLAAAEYRKLYTEKQKMEKKLTRLYQKLGERKNKSVTSQLPDQPATAELISLSQASSNSSEAEPGTSTQSSGSVTFNSTCPICSVKFPPGANDLFAQHFESHLS